MKKEAPVLYTLGFIVITMLFLGLTLALGLFVGKGFFKENELSTPTFKEGAITYIIDAGHGGEDAGAIAPDGTLEKDLNLEIAYLVADLLELNGKSVKMTRTEDTLLYDYYGDLKDYTGQKKVYDLKNRLKIAEENENPLFVSIHMNKFSIPKYKGLQVYYSKNSKESAVVARAIKESNALYLQPENKREIKMADSSIFVLDRIKAPAVLIECGFLSNVEELSLLKDENYRAKLALTVFYALSDTK